MSNTPVNNISVLSDAELDAVGGGAFNFNYGSITQVNAVGAGLAVNQSNQALAVQANQSRLYVSAFFSNYQH
jgi:stage V sporulation protein SpoVS